MGGGANLLVAINFAEKCMEMKKKRHWEEGACILRVPRSATGCIMFIFIHKSLLPSLCFVEEEIVTQTFVLVRTEFHYNSWIDLF